MASSPAIAPVLVAHYLSINVYRFSNSAKPMKCLSGRAWSSDAAAFSSTPPPTGACLDLRSGQVLLGARALPTPALVLSGSFQGLPRFFSTGQSRRPPGERWRREDPSSVSRMFASASRLAPEFCSSLPLTTALDIVSFLWQARVMAATSKDSMASGLLAESPDLGGTGVRMSAFTPEGSAPSVFAATRPTLSFGFSPPASFLTPARPAPPGRISLDEVSGMIVGIGGTVLALGLPKRPSGAVVSRLRDRPGWTGIDPQSFAMCGEYRRPRSVPVLVSTSPEEGMLALMESWLFLSSRFSPRNPPAVKLRCDFVLDRHWCVLESPGTIVPRSAGKDESRAARRSEEAKMKAAISSITGTGECPALSVFFSPGKFPRRSTPPIQPSNAPTRPSRGYGSRS